MYSCHITYPFIVDTDISLSEAINSANHLDDYQQRLDATSTVACFWWSYEDTMRPKCEHFRDITNLFSWLKFYSSSIFGYIYIYILLELFFGGGHIFYIRMQIIVVLCAEIIRRIARNLRFAHIIRIFVFLSCDMSIYRDHSYLILRREPFYASFC